MKRFQLSPPGSPYCGPRATGHEWARQLRIFCLLTVALFSAHASALTVRNVTLSVDPQNSGVSTLQNPNPAYDGENVTIKVLGVPAGCAFLGWVENSQIVSTSTPYVIPTIHADHTLVAQFVVGGYNSYTPIAWTDGVIPFYFDGNVTSAHQAVALEEMQNWSFETGCRIAFVPWQGSTTNPGRSLLKIANSTIQSVNTTDRTGMTLGGTENTVAIANWDQPSPISHEFGHVLGLRHAHQRPDRNNYLSVQWANFTDSASNVNSQYAVYKESDWLAGTYIAGEAYDLLSIMHYPPRPNEFAPVELVAKPGVPNADIWNNGIYVPTIQLSDITHVRNVYGVNAESRFVNDTGGVGGNGSLTEPYQTIAFGILSNSARNDPGSRLWVKPGTYVSSMARLTGPQKILPYPGGGPVRITR